MGDTMRAKSFILYFVLIFSVFLFSPSWVVSAELYVDDDNLTEFEDGSLKYPFNTIQEAVNAIVDDEENNIRVAGGEYNENIMIENKTATLSGGYEGGKAADYTSGTGGTFTTQDTEINVSHIKGDGTNAVIRLVDAGSSIINGFRVTGGNGFTDPWKSKGGGLYVSGGSPTVVGNIIENNDVHQLESSDLTTFGGGIYCESSDIRISNNVIQNNAAGGGGGISVDGGTVVIIGNTIQSNTADSFAHGGGLLVDSPNASITNNQFIQNEVGRDIGYGWGGGVVIFGDNSAAVLSNNIYTKNYAPTAGGGLFVDDGAQATLDHELIYNNESISNGGAGIYVDGAWDEIGSTATLSNCTIADNICTDCIFPGSGIAVEYYSNVTVIDSIFWGNGGDDFFVDETSGLIVTYSVSQENIEGQGNLNSDPFFADTTTNDYHLKSTIGRWRNNIGWVADLSHSPAIDSGNPGSGYTNELDPNGSRVNMGVYGDTTEASKSKPSVTIPKEIEIKGCSVSQIPQLNSPTTITIDAQHKSGDTIYYRFSMHPKYGTYEYDGSLWESITTTEYITENQCDYSFSTSGKSIVVVWAASSGTDSVDPTGIPIIGWSVDTSESECKTNFNGVTITGEQKVNEKITFTIDAENACSASSYYRFSLHPYYGTTAYDGSHWKSMTSTEWISNNSIDYSFTEVGKYIIVVWVSDDIDNYDMDGIPTIGWSVDIE